MQGLRRVSSASDHPRAPVALLYYSDFRGDYDVHGVCYN